MGQALEPGRDRTGRGNGAAHERGREGSACVGCDDHPCPVGNDGLALWRVGDPGNVGALLRAADALGPAFVALSEGCADPAGPKALRASAGTAFRVPTCAFEESPRPWVALVPRGGRRLSELAVEGRTTFVLGAEREGLPDDVLENCDESVTIPQSGAAESLNVAMAGTIALYERRRSRD